MAGFFKLDRKIIDSEVFAHEGQLRFWLWLLCKANYKDSFVSVNTGSGQKTIQIKRGSLLFGRNSASEIVGTKPTTLYSWLKKFKSMQMIDLNSDKHFTIVTICKYEEYQSNDKDDLTNQCLTTDEPLTNQCQTTDIYKNIKKDKKLNKIKNTTFVPPTIDEISDELKRRCERRFTAEEIFNYYNDMDWKFKDGSPVKSWKGCITTWSKSRDEKGEKQPLTEAEKLWVWEQGGRRRVGDRIEYNSAVSHAEITNEKIILIREGSKNAN